jgi:hypothetical protein
VQCVILVMFKMTVMECACVRVAWREFLQPPCCAHFAPVGVLQSVPETMHSSSSFAMELRRRTAVETYHFYVALQQRPSHFSRLLIHKHLGSLQINFTSLIASFLFILILL